MTTRCDVGILGTTTSETHRVRGRCDRSSISSSSGPCRNTSTIPSVSTSQTNLKLSPRCRVSQMRCRNGWGSITRLNLLIHLIRRPRGSRTRDSKQRSDDNAKRAAPNPRPSSLEQQEPPTEQQPVGGSAREWGFSAPYPTPTDHVASQSIWRTLLHCSPPMP